MRRWLYPGLLAGALAAVLGSELRVTRPLRPLSQTWQTLPIHPRGSTRLGLSFRPPQVDALGLEPRSSLQRLLAYPFEMLRLGAYWRRLEPNPGQFVPDELDWQLEAAERAGKQVLVCVGAVKTFGYPEFFVPAWRLPRPISEGVVLHTSDHSWLLEPALEFVSRIVERYRHCSAIVGWQIEHESVDPLGLEHSWRLGTDFVAAEIEAVRAADPSRPILLNGFLPMSNLVGLQQWWRTRDQGDSLQFAVDHADIVGLDVYPRHGLISLGPLTAYLDGGNGPGPKRLRARLLQRIRTVGRRVMVTEGQAEPWETVVEPPSPHAGAMYSCTPEQLVANYNACIQWTPALQAYLFWGAEYWLLRAQSGDDSYLQAFARVLEEA
jgi:hypothetical protein